MTTPSFWTPPSELTPPLYWRVIDNEEVFLDRFEDSVSLASIWPALLKKFIAYRVADTERAHRKARLCTNEDDELLTPNNFLLGGSGRVQIPASVAGAELDSKQLWLAKRLVDRF
ncbi:hypothetical protein EVAR_43322_1 [Eumeta japonica]|uniref:Uncharacterized protein n=1 Tax=Eumeta variegata TaxID=151549 RepID=A0A4C1WSE0_EUMVA|nr:hypothetical protein EVAR_43322_1 [Eumeta japonica]